MTAQRDQRQLALVEVFEQAVASYRTGNVEGARSRLLGLSASEQRIAARALLDRERENHKRRPASAAADSESVKLVRAAAALLMELTAEEARAAITTIGADVMNLRTAVAGELIAYVTERTGREDQFIARWLTAIGVDALARGKFQLAPEIISPVCRKEPAFAPLLLTCAIAHESYSIMSHDTALAIRQTRGPGAALSLARRERSESLRLARRYFERAAELAPGDTEAPLRLGYVCLRTADVAEATRILESVVARPDLLARTSYLARLFLGRAYEEQKRLPDAQRAYTGALAAVSAQSVLLALSHNAQLQGRASDAAEFAERATTMQRSPDPWWAYFFGQYWMAPDLFVSLRKEALQ